MMSTGKSNEQCQLKACGGEVLLSAQALVAFVVKTQIRAVLGGLPTPSLRDMESSTSMDASVHLKFTHIHQGML